MFRVILAIAMAIAPMTASAECFVNPDGSVTCSNSYAFPVARSVVRNVVEAPVQIVGNVVSAAPVVGYSTTYAAPTSRLIRVRRGLFGLRSSVVAVPVAQSSESYGCTGGYSYSTRIRYSTPVITSYSTSYGSTGGFTSVLRENPYEKPTDRVGAGEAATAKPADDGEPTPAAQRSDDHFGPIRTTTPSVPDGATTESARSPATRAVASLTKTNEEFAWQKQENRNRGLVAAMTSPSVTSLRFAQSSPLLH